MIRPGTTTLCYQSIEGRICMQSVKYLFLEIRSPNAKLSIPYGNWTRVFAVKGQCPHH